jgi:hypothetical protein
MADASAAVVGRAMAVSASAVGVDEVDPDILSDFVSWTQTPRSPGYLRRIKAWEDRVGREVIPYR